MKRQDVELENMYEDRATGYLNGNTSAFCVCSQCGSNVGYEFDSLVHCTLYDVIKL